MNKNILVFSFYYQPDLSAGSFRNTTLVNELSKGIYPGKIIVITTKPNRYNDYKVKALTYEINNNVIVHRVNVPEHKSGLIDQIKAYTVYFLKGLLLANKYQVSLIYSSSGRLFTLLLSTIIAKRKKIPLYVDIRDIFIDTISDLYDFKILKNILLSFLNRIEKYCIRYAININLISPGFNQYYKNKYSNLKITNFTNGIDDEFIHVDNNIVNDYEQKIILYAGNIGEGQGLHIIIPDMAKNLPEYTFMIIGNGGAKEKLISKVAGMKNVEIKAPVKRAELINYYNKSKFNMIHLNNIKAFEKVLPSKIFELSAINKPIIAGVSGYAKEFLKENVSECYIFDPGDYKTAINIVQSYSEKNINRKIFKEKYRRSVINKNMSKSIMSYL